MKLSLFCASTSKLFRLKNISLTQFKNYPTANFSFNERITGICGKNGIGKTNLLDAIYYLCFTRSYFTRSDLQNVSTGMQGFRLTGEFLVKGEDTGITCIVRETGKKEFACNAEAYTKFSDHIGRFPAVMIAPDDVQLISGGGEERRRFLDALLSQTDRSYLSALISYNKILQQRNSLLKSFAESKRTDENLLEVLNQQLMKPGTMIFEKRKAFLAGFVTQIGHFYKRISGETYDISVLYESQLLHTSYENLFHQFRDKDLLLLRTGAGIHKDDLEITLNGQLFKTMASQGQRKSLLFALKLAEYETLKVNKGFSPLLLLDDIFEKLDEGRMENLLQWVCKENDGQIFITDTHCERLKAHLVKPEVAFQLINL